MSGNGPWTVGKGSDDRVRKIKQFGENFDEIDMSGIKKRKGIKVKSKTNGRVTRYVYK